MLTASALNSSEYRRRVFLVMNTSNASSMRLTGVSAPIRPVQKPVKRTPDRILAVDVGINTAATWAVVDAQGTVHARGFISRTDKDRECRLMNRIRQAAKKHTRHGSRLPPGFCRRDHQRLTHLADNQAHQDRKSTRLNSSHVRISYAVFCLK